MQCQKDLGLPPKRSTELNDDEILRRLSLLIADYRPLPEQKAVLGLVRRPS